jgi:hypothetical protein
LCNHAEATASSRASHRLWDVKRSSLWSHVDHNLDHLVGPPGSDRRTRGKAILGRSMPPTDVETLRAGYEAINRGDYEAAFQMMDPAIEWQPDDRTPFAGTYHGREGGRELLETFLEALDHFRWEPEDFFSRSGGRVGSPNRPWERKWSGGGVPRRPPLDDARRQTRPMARLCRAKESFGSRRPEVRLASTLGPRRLGPRPRS